MKFTADRVTFLDALASVEKYVDARSNTPVLQFVKISVSEAGALTLTATDLGRAASSSMACNVGEPGETCVPCRPLFRAVKASRGADVHVDVSPRETLVKVGRSEFKFPTIPVVEFPSPPILTKECSGKFTTSAAALSAALKVTNFAVSADYRTRIMLTGALWSAVDGELEICGTDAKILSCIRLPMKGDAPNVIVPVLDIPDCVDNVLVEFSDKFIRLTFNSMVVASTLVEGQFPPYRRLFPQNASDIFLDRSELVSAVTRMKAVGDKKSALLLVGRDGELVISAESDAGGASDTIPFGGEDFQIALVADLLSPILASMDCDTIKLGWTDHSTAVVIQPSGNDKRATLCFPYADSRLSKYLPKKVA